MLVPITFRNAENRTKRHPLEGGKQLKKQAFKIYCFYFGGLRE